MLYNLYIQNSENNYLLAVVVIKVTTTPSCYYSFGKWANDPNRINPDCECWMISDSLSMDMAPL
jgi:hypothetical protein